MAAYPDAKCTLDFKNPFQLLIMTALAAQCTDARVNIVCKDLFKKYKGPADFLKVPVEELEKDINNYGERIKEHKLQMQGLMREIEKIKSESKDAVADVIEGTSRAHYYPDGEPMAVKVLSGMLTW